MPSAIVVGDQTPAMDAATSAPAAAPAAPAPNAAEAGDGPPPPPPLEGSGLSEAAFNALFVDGVQVGCPAGSSCMIYEGADLTASKHHCAF